MFVIRKGKINMQEHINDEHKKHEIINGEIVYMSPRPLANHNTVVTNVSGIFYTYLKGKPCKTYSDGNYIRLDKIKNSILPEKNQKDRLIPDVMIVCNRDIDKYDGVYGAPDLVVEVLSPSTAKNDKNIKKNIYELIGVKEYWIVDVKNRSIEVYLLKNGKYILDDIYHQYSDIEIEMIMDDVTIEDKTIITEFKTSLYDDLVIQIDDVFDKLI